MRYTESIIKEFDDNLLICMKLSRQSNVEGSFYVYQMKLPIIKRLLQRKPKFKVTTPRVLTDDHNVISIELTSRLVERCHSESSIIECNSGYVSIGVDIVPWLMAENETQSMASNIVAVLDDSVVIPISEPTKFKLERYYDHRGGLSEVALIRIPRGGM